MPSKSLARWLALGALLLSPACALVQGATTTSFIALGVALLAVLATAAVATYQKNHPPADATIFTAKLRSARLKVTPMHGDKTSRRSLQFVARPEATRYEINLRYGLNLTRGRA